VFPNICSFSLKSWQRVQINIIVFKGIVVFICILAARKEAEVHTAGFTETESKA